MKKNILQYLENNTQTSPDKVVFEEIQRSVTYQDFIIDSKKIGSSLSEKNTTNQPICIFIDKTISCLESMMGILYSGNFYTILDTNSPEDRIRTILSVLKPIAVITDQKNLIKAEKLGVFSNLLLYEDLINTKIDEKNLSSIREKMIDTDPAYVLFTSGSTGIPKGTVVSHKAVISYVSWYISAFSIDSNTIFGSQTPFYFSMSVSDIFSTLFTGATFVIIPKMYFSFPVKLLEFLKERKINTIYWVPSALSIVANLGALENINLPDLQKILFAGEVMPIKQLNIWKKALPNAFYANLYGPTETTDICTYYVVNREFTETQTLPIGKPCNNCDVILIKDDGTQASKEEEGELCVRGSFLAMGYFSNPEKTNSNFIQNPLNFFYPEIIYKTGDIVKYNEYGELIYLSRKDFQIKHMGYRIELGEIETVINSLDSIIACCCVYDNDSDTIVLFYQSTTIEENDLTQLAKDKLLPYMRPNKMIKLDRMPYNANGKLDRVILKNKLKEI